VGGWQRQPPARLGRRHRLGLAPHRLDRPQRRRGEEIGHQRRQQQRDRPADEELGAQALERVRPLLQRRADHDHQQPAVLGVDGRGEQPDGLVGAGEGWPVDDDRRPGRAGELGAAEQRTTVERGRAVDDHAAGVDHLSEALLLLGEPGRLPLPQAADGLLDQGGDVVGAAAEALLDRPVERDTQAQIEEQAHGQQDDRHGDGEHQRQPQPDRHARERTHHPHPPSWRSR
jgi:hypothetical protein